MFRPTPDDFTYSPANLLEHLPPKKADIPIMIGTNQNEGATFAVDEDDFAAYIDLMFHAFGNNLTSSIAEAYAVGSPGIKNDYEAISQFLTEFVF